jgi:hypothetical protein
VAWTNDLGICTAISAEEFHAHFDPNNEKYREISAWQEALLMVMTTRRATRRAVETSTLTEMVETRFCLLRDRGKGILSAVWRHLLFFLFSNKAGL